MKNDNNILFFKFSLVIITLIIFANQLGHRDILGLAGVLTTIPLIFAADIFEHFTKQKISHALELTYLFFILFGSIIGLNMMAFDMGQVYDKVVHFLSGILTVLVVRELFGKEILKQRTVIKFFFYAGMAALVAVAWETYEFLIDVIFNADMQRTIQWGTHDTMIDLIAAVSGGIVIWVFLHAKRKV